MIDAVLVGAVAYHIDVHVDADDDVWVPDVFFEQFDCPHPPIVVRQE